MGHPAEAFALVGGLRARGVWGDASGGEVRPKGEPSAEREPLGGGWFIGRAEAVAAAAVPLSTTVGR